MERLMSLSLFGLLLLTQPLHSSEQHTRANLENSSNFAIYLLVEEAIRIFSQIKFPLATSRQLCQVLFSSRVFQMLRWLGVAKLVLDNSLLVDTSLFLRQPMLKPRNQNRYINSTYIYLKSYFLGKRRIHLIN